MRRRIASPPHAASRPAEGPSETILRLILRASVGILVPLFFAVPLLTHHRKTVLFIYGSALSIVLISLLLLRLRYVRTSAVFVCCALGLLGVLLVWHFGGPRSPHQIVFFPLIVITGMIWSERAAVVMMLSSSLVMLGMVWAEAAGFLPPSEPVESLRMWAGFLTAAGITTLLLVISLRTLKAASAQLEHQAFHDSLTELPNRAALHYDFNNHLAKALKNQGRAALVLIDLDRFKEVNDSLGHHVGDKLLKQVGPRISSSLRKVRPQPYRLGGDEFAVLLPHIADLGQSVDLVGEILTILKRPFRVDDLVLEIGASAGVSVYPEHGYTSNELLRCADVAMYDAKRTQKGVALYQRASDPNNPERLALASQLRRALNAGELALHYQPKVSLDDGRTVGFEALIRWQHSERGLLLPGEFLPVAEVGEQIHPLTAWVVENALAQLRRWNDQKAGLTMAINLSARNLLDQRFASRIQDLIKRSGVAPSSVEFELTETALMTEFEVAVQNLRRITATGAKLTIDDFGTGYSSFTYLRRFSIHALKLDRSFVRDMLNDPQSRAIVLSAIQLAKNLGLELVAEGVEDRETGTALRKLGCRFAQGFYFSPPAPPESIQIQRLPSPTPS